MRKIYLLAASLMLGVASIAQTTITEHFEGALVNPQAPAIGIYNWDGDAGYLSGNNTYGDLGIVQRFTPTSGVTSGGTINTVSVYIPIKLGSGTYEIAVWADNNGEIGEKLGFATLNLSDLDTTQAGITPILINNGTAMGGIFNAVGNLNIEIPSNKSFFAGVVLPTGADQLAVLTTQINSGTHFANSGAIASDGTFDSYALNGANLSLAIFPTVTYTSSLTINTKDIKVFPNPAKNLVNFQVDGLENGNVVISSITGQVVVNTTISGTAKVDVSNLNNGVYIYKIVDANGEVVKTNKLVINK